MKRQAVVFVGDGHCACRYGLYPANCDVYLDAGVRYVPSQSQQVMWEWWQQFWTDFVPKVAGDAKRTIVLGGDWLQGVHPRWVTPVTNNTADQLRIAENVLRPVIRKRDAVYALRGTEAHVGPSGETEETLARMLGCVPDRDGQHSRYSLELPIGKWAVHATHHISVSSRALGEIGVVGRDLADIFTEAARWGGGLPDLFARFHGHRACLAQVPVAGKMCTMTTVTGWQLATPFTWRKRGSKRERPQIGGAVAVFDNTSYAVHHFVRDIECR